MSSLDPVSRGLPILPPPHPPAVTPSTTPSWDKTRLSYLDSELQITRSTISRQSAQTSNLEEPRSRASRHGELHQTLSRLSSPGKDQQLSLTVIRLSTPRQDTPITPREDIPRPEARTKSLVKRVSGYTPQICALRRMRTESEIVQQAQSLLSASDSSYRDLMKTEVKKLGKDVSFLLVAPKNAPGWRSGASGWREAESVRRGDTVDESQSFDPFVKKHIYMCQSPSLIKRSSRVHSGVNHFKRALFPSLKQATAPTYPELKPPKTPHSVTKPDSPRRSFESTKRKRLTSSRYKFMEPDVTMMDIEHSPRRLLP